MFALDLFTNNWNKCLDCLNRPLSIYERFDIEILMKQICYKFDWTRFIQHLFNNHFVIEDAESSWHPSNTCCDIWLNKCAYIIGTNLRTYFHFFWHQVCETVEWMLELFKRLSQSLVFAQCLFNFCLTLQALRVRSASIITVCSIRVVTRTKDMITHSYIILNLLEMHGGNTKKNSNFGIKG